MPYDLILQYGDNQEKVYRAYIHGYDWEKKRIHVHADSVGPTEIDYDEVIEAKVNDKIYFKDFDGRLGSINLYTEEKESIKLITEFNNEDKYFVVPDVIGTYIMPINSLCEKGKVTYSIKINISN